MDEMRKKKIAQKLSLEYHMKSRFLSNLKEGVCTIKKEIYRSLGQECSLVGSVNRVPSLVEAVCWREKLHQVAGQLQNVYLDDSPEHSRLKQLQRHVQLSLINTSTQETEVYELVTVIADLNQIHESLCGLKEEIENEINTALQTLAKAQIHLMECDITTNGESSDHMTHFVKQHINQRRRRLPFQDLTNRDISTNPHHSRANVQLSAPVCDEEIDKTYLDIPQSDVNDSVPTDKIRNFNASRNIVHQQMYKENMSLSDTSHDQGSPNLRLLNLNSIENVITTGVRRSSSQNVCLELCAQKGAAYSLEFSPVDAARKSNKQGIGLGLSAKTGAAKSLEDSSVARLSHAFDFGIAVSAGFNIGVECQRHGSCNGKIKLSHFSTPHKPVCKSVRNPAIYDPQKSSTCNISQKPVSDFVPDRHVSDHVPDRPVSDHVPDRPVPDRPVQDRHVPDRQSLEPAAMMPQKEEEAMDIPFIDDDLL